MENEETIIREQDAKEDVKASTEALAPVVIDGVKQAGQEMAEDIDRAELMKLCKKGVPFKKAVWDDGKDKGLTVKERKLREKAAIAALNKEISILTETLAIMPPNTEAYRETALDVKILCEAQSTLTKNKSEVTKSIAGSIIPALVNIAGIGLTLFVEHKCGPRVGNRDAMNQIPKPRI